MVPNWGNQPVLNEEILQSAFLRLLAAAGYDMKVVKAGHVRTLKDILAEQRASTETPK